MANELLTEMEAAEVLKVSHRTLQKWRSEGKGPAVCRLGNAVRYRRRDLDVWCKTLANVVNGVPRDDGGPLFWTTEQLHLAFQIVLEYATGALMELQDGRVLDIVSAIERGLGPNEISSLLGFLSDEAECGEDKVTGRRDDRLDSFEFVLATQEWRCGERSGRGLVSCLIVFLNRDQEAVVSMIAELVGRGLLQYLTDARARIAEGGGAYSVRVR